VPEVTRRDVLRLSAVVAGAAAVASLTACTRDGGAPEPTAPGGPEDPDRALRAAIGASESALIAMYAAAVPLLTGTQAQRVQRLGQRHAAYRQAIDPDGLATTSPTSTPDPGASPTATPSPAVTPWPAPPASASAALSALREAERTSADGLQAQCVLAVDAELARVVALAGAGSAAAAAELRRLS
jgi:hypothetical protein